MTRIALVSFIILLSALAPFSVRGQDKEIKGESDNPWGGARFAYVVNQMAEVEFNLHDRNGDGFLSKAEMPAELKSELSKWDTNRDNLISLDEFKAYYTARMQRLLRAHRERSTIIRFIIEEDPIKQKPPREQQYHLPDVPKPLDLGFESRPGGGVVGTSSTARDLTRLCPALSAAGTREPNRRTVD
ncbi:MAG TPA: EF-hand domain-containing protein [Gemmataceae bacterium]|jgi:hypothetical protein|nr:EF-hand domain-containing protein [Gemmataceae bacterium]